MPNLSSSSCRVLVIKSRRSELASCSAGTRRATKPATPSKTLICTDGHSGCGTRGNRNGDSELCVGQVCNSSIVMACRGYPGALSPPILSATVLPDDTQDALDDLNPEPSDRVGNASPPGRPVLTNAPDARQVPTYS